MTESAQYLVGKTPFRIGVSYWPRRSGLELWKRFDLDEIHEDFSILSEVGVNVARVTLLWEDFQPEPDSLRCSALAHLLGLCDAAASEGIRLELLLFAGQKGAPNHYPRWLHDHANQGGLDTGCEMINPFSHPLAKQAATALVRGIARCVGNHPAVWAYNLGDRPDRLAPHCCRVAAKAWLDELSQAIRAVDTKHPITCSMGGTNLFTDPALRVDKVFAVLDHSTIDSEELADDLGQLAPESQASFSCALTTALTGKRCLLQDSWQLTNVSLEASRPEHEEGSLDERSISPQSLLVGLHRVGALGAVLGSFSDLPDECSTGLVNGGRGLLDIHGQPHSYAEAIQEFARSKPMVKSVADNPVALGMTADEYYEEPRAHLRRLYGEFHSRHLAASDR
jgi:hypothetical protein